MEITKDIKINTTNLISNSEIEINYSGTLINSKDVYILYGYNPNSFEYDIKKLENNSVKIQIEQSGFFYFYFVDENGNKDNNEYKDYQLYIKTSNLILTENSSMKELPYRYFGDYKQNIYKTFYTAQLFRNTSRPQEIILPRALNFDNTTTEAKTINGYIVEPVKPVVNFNITEALIPTENLTSISMLYSKNKTMKNLYSSFNKLLLGIPKLFGKNYS